MIIVMSIFELKRQLLIKLLELNPAKVTENDADIMYSLSKDPEIQKLLDTDMAETKNETN